MRTVLLLLISVIAACDANDVEIGQLKHRPAGAPRDLGSSHSGCWVLDWSPNQGVPTHGILVFPDSIYLAATSDDTGWRRVEPATALEGRAFDPLRGDPSQIPWEAHFRSNRWSLQGDSTVLLFSDGAWERWRLVLRLSDGRLRGDAEYWSDAGPGEPPLTAKVLGTPFYCLMTF